MILLYGFLYFLIGFILSLLFMYVFTDVPYFSNTDIIYAGSIFLFYPIILPLVLLYLLITIAGVLTAKTIYFIIGYNRKGKL